MRQREPISPVRKIEDGDGMTVPDQRSRLLICNCQKTMDIDGERLAGALSQPSPLTVYSELCRGQIGAFEASLEAGGDVRVACTQEAPLFREIAEGKARASNIRFTNIRERAGWCADKPAALPKIAALLAEAAYDTKPAGAATLKSEGVCLVYGRGQGALDAAFALSGRLSVTVLLTDPDDALPPAIASVPINRGHITRASGHLGAFQIEVNGYAPMVPSSRQSMQFVLPRDGARSTCDVIFDMSGGTPLFADAKRRDGYFRVDPNNPAAVARAMFEIADMIGEFEKPLYVAYEAGLCAHARSQKVGCSNCIDHCPTGAIAPDGDHVAVDPAICGGCGSCAAVCPTGAIGYDYPGRTDFLSRVRILLETYRKAGGVRPVVLFHDEKHGAPLISAMSRLGRGLPPNVLPMSLFSVHQIGHDQLAAALTLGAEHILVVAPPEDSAELAALEGQIALMRCILDGLGFRGPRLHLSTEFDPDALESILYELPAMPLIPVAPFSMIGSKREVARMALAKLKSLAPEPKEVIDLPAGAPYGRIRVDVAGCTLCLACVGACPANALSDDPDRPRLAFTEAACVQCGICVATCPEKVIRLEPRYNFAPGALSPEVLNTEEPFHCVSCGKPFGTKSTIERVVARLKGRNAMFQTEAQLRLIQMCDTCRVVAMAEEGTDPLKGPPRPRVRTTDDYVRIERRSGKPGKTPDDFLN
jgi:ferredoxin